MCWCVLERYDDAPALLCNADQFLMPLWTVPVTPYLSHCVNVREPKRLCKSKHFCLDDFAELDHTTLLSLPTQKLKQWHRTEAGAAKAGAGCPTVALWSALEHAQQL